MKTISQKRYGLWSLYDMFDLNAQQFLKTVNTLGKIPDLVKHFKLSGGIQDIHAPIDKVIRDGIAEHLALFILEADEIGASNSAQHGRRLIHMIQESPMSWESLHNTISMLEVGFYDEMEIFHILLLDRTEARQFECGANLFHSDTQLRFPDCFDDMDGAAKCYALGQSTACVFHLMRVVEFAVREWASTFTTLTGTRPRTGVEYDKSWNDLESEIQGKVDSLPATTLAEREIKDAQRGALVLLGNVRHAWRNPTMHPAAKYTPIEAKYILDTVVAFMDRLAKLI